MNKQWLIYFSDFHITTIGLILFFVLFFSVTLWTFRPHSKKIYQQIEKLPLQLDNEV